MKKIISSLAISMAVLGLSACSMFYPNWGATELPTPSQSATATTSATPTSTPEPTQSQSASPTPTIRIAADVQVLDASADATAGTLTVIAQVNNVTETGGTCTLTLKAGGVTKSFPSVKAESNAASTQCFPITIGLTGLPSGPAAVQVDYESESATGKSNYFAVTIP